MELERYTTLAGETLEYPRPNAEVGGFLARVFDATNNPNVGEGELIDLIYGKENPILDQTIFPARGAVTKEVFTDPVYHLMTDLLDHKRVQMGTLDLHKAHAAFTMTVQEAARKLGITQGAVRNAIVSRRMPAIKKGGVYLLDPKAVESFHVSPRGPKARS
jgi:excisionase family DNA binding protein